MGIYFRETQNLIRLCIPFKDILSISRSNMSTLRGHKYLSYALDSEVSGGKLE